MKNEDAGKAKPGRWNSKKIDKTLYEQLEELSRQDLKNVKSETVERVMDELKHVDPDDTNVIFIFTEGDTVITAVHAPRETLDGQDGPLLTQGADDNVIIAAFSRESILELIRKIDSDMEEQPGLRPWAESLWATELENLADAVKLELAKNPPQKWGDTWLGEIE